MDTPDLRRCNGSGGRPEGAAGAAKYVPEHDAPFAVPRPPLLCCPPSDAAPSPPASCPPPNPPPRHCTRASGIALRGGHTWLCCRAHCPRCGVQLWATCEPPCWRAPLGSRYAPMLTCARALAPRREEGTRTRTRTRARTRARNQACVAPDPLPPFPTPTSRRNDGRLPLPPQQHPSCVAGCVPTGVSAWGAGPGEPPRRHPPVWRHAAHPRLRGDPRVLRGGQRGPGGVRGLHRRHNPGGAGQVRRRGGRRLARALVLRFAFPSCFAHHHPPCAL
jgi:hypothetical protein